MAGYIVMLNGGIVSYASKQLKVIAASSCEAEYAAATMCAHDITFIRNVCEDLAFVIQGPIVLYVDNDACIKVAKDPGVSSANKHFERGIHYIRQQCDTLRVDIIWVPTKHQMADFMTKILDTTQFQYCRDYAFNAN